MPNHDPLGILSTTNIARAAVIPAIQARPTTKSSRSPAVTPDARSRLCRRCSAPRLRQL